MQDTLGPPSLPLPGASGPDKFFYDPFANVESSDFAAARAFFIHNGHTIVYHECPDAIAFKNYSLWLLFDTSPCFSRVSSLKATASLMNNMRFSASLNTRMLLLPPHPSHLLDPSLIIMWLQGLQDHRAAPLLHQPPSVTLPTNMARTIYGLPLQLHTGLATPHPQFLYCTPPFGDTPVSPHNPRYPDGYLTDQASPIPCNGGNNWSYAGQWADPYGGHPFSWYGGRYKRRSQVPCKVPYYIFQQGYPPAQPVMGPHAATSVASSIYGSCVLLRSLPHADSHLASASNLTASFVLGLPILGAPGNPAFGLGHLPIPGQISPQAHIPQAAPVFPVVHVPMMAPTIPAVAPAAPFPAVHVPMMAPTIPAVTPAASSPPAVAPPTPALPPLPPATPTTARVELLKLDPITADAKAFLDSFKTIQYYL
jgi:hypothetical protein